MEGFIIVIWCITIVVNVEGFIIVIWCIPIVIITPNKGGPRRCERLVDFIRGTNTANVTPN